MAPQRYYIGRFKVLGKATFAAKVGSERAAFLETLVVEDETLDQVLAESLRRPAAKLRTTVRTNTVANRQDDIEVVAIHRAADLSGSFNLNYQVLLDGCRWVQDRRWTRRCCSKGCTDAE